MAVYLTYGNAEIIALLDEVNVFSQKFVGLYCQSSYFKRSILEKMLKECKKDF